MQLTTLLSLAFALPILANDLYPRAAYAGGGFGLVSSNCPAGTKSFICGSCCPIGFAIQNTCGTSPEGTACCPDGTSCGEALQATPFCADSSWVLWNTTTGGLFCCLQGQLGTNSLQCVNGATVVAATLAANKIGQPVPTGAAGSTIAVSGASTASVTGSSAKSSVTGVVTKTVIGTTTKNGIASIITSLISEATSKGDASVMRPLGGYFMMKYCALGLGSLILGTLGAVAIVTQTF